MTSVVVDASVAIRWCLPLPDEELVPAAEDLLNQYDDRTIGFLVPDLFWVEVASVMVKAVRRKRISREHADDALDQLRNLAIPTIATATLTHEATQLALAHNCSVYDCIYVALAMQRNTEFVTADEKLANAVAAYLPVKWLGAY